MMRRTGIRPTSVHVGRHMACEHPGMVPPRRDRVVNTSVTANGLTLHERTHESAALLRQRAERDYTVLDATTAVSKDSRFDIARSAGVRHITRDTGAVTAGPRPIVNANYDNRHLYTDVQIEGLRRDVLAEVVTARKQRATHLPVTTLADQSAAEGEPFERTSGKKLNAWTAPSVLRDGQVSIPSRSFIAPTDDGGDGPHRYAPQTSIRTRATQPIIATNSITPAANSVDYLGKSVH